MFTFTLFKKTHTVASLAEASALFNTLRDKSGRGSSSMPLPDVMEDGKRFGRFSYNGKIWANSHWVPGATPLFDPYA